MTVVRDRRKFLRLLSCTAIAVAVAPSCAGDTTPGSRLGATRVLGARTESLADPTQNWPRPGEAFRVTWLVAGPAAPRPLAWAFRAAACPGNAGAAACLADGLPVPANAAGSERGSNAGAPTALPTLELTVPDAASVAARGLTKIVVQGVVCAGGAVGDIDGPPWARCATPSTDGLPTVDETDVEATVIVRLGDDGNQPPTLGDDALTWEGAPWTAGAGDAPNAGAGVGASVEVGAGCAADAASWIVPADGQSRSIALATDEGDRGWHPVAAPAPGAADRARESLQLSAFATEGSFESQFGGIEGTDVSPAPTIAAKWLPAEVTNNPVAPEGRQVRFVFVLRDLRGGIDWATRTACLVPATGG